MCSRTSQRSPHLKITNARLISRCQAFCIMHATSRSISYQSLINCLRWEGSSSFHHTTPCITRLNVTQGMNRTVRPIYFNSVSGHYWQIFLKFVYWSCSHATTKMDVVAFGVNCLSPGPEYEVRVAPFPLRPLTVPDPSLSPGLHRASYRT